MFLTDCFPEALALLTGFIVLSLLFGSSAATPSSLTVLFSDFFLRQVLEVIQKDFLLRLFRQFGKSRRKGTAI